MKKVLLIEKRKKARKLRERGWSIRKIAQSLAAGKDSVSKWINISEIEISSDSRGWRKGELRKHKDVERERSIGIRKQLEKEGSYFIGELVVQKNYESLYGEKIKSWFIKKVLKEAGLSKKREAKVSPSVMQLRSEDIRPHSVGKIVLQGLSNAKKEIEHGALLTIDPRKSRIRLLPLKPKIS
jgi:hypothetical protein